jgi:hypothetical protein
VARAELSAELTEEEVEELVQRGLMPSYDTFRERANAASEQRGRDD